MIRAYPINYDDRSHGSEREFQVLDDFKTGSADMTPVIGSAWRVRGEVTLTFELID